MTKNITKSLTCTITVVAHNVIYCATTCTHRVIDTGKDKRLCKLFNWVELNKVAILGGKNTEDVINFEYKRCDQCLMTFGDGE
jgi:hypothetical protein